MLTMDEPAGTACELATVPVTACIISFNEEERIEECLQSVRFCEQIVVIDSHSTDRTREIASAFTDKIVERDWPGHIDQKNFAIDQASTDWVLCLDCDERVTPELREAIIGLFKDGGPDLDGYEIPRRTFYLGRFIDHGGFYPDRKLRLFRRQKGRWGGTNPHDHVYLEDPSRVGVVDADLHHYSYRNISDHLKTVDYFTTIAAHEKLAKGASSSKAILNLLFGPAWKFFKMFVLQRGFLDGGAGLIVALIGAFYVMLKYAKLWELICVEGRHPGQGEKVVYGRKGEAM